MGREAFMYFILPLKFLFHFILYLLCARACDVEWVKMANNHGFFLHDAESLVGKTGIAQ